MEYAHLENCTVVVVWVPRNLDTMPAFTTNVEFGSYVRSGRMIYGRPDNAVKCDYLDWLYTKITSHTPHNDLRKLLCDAIVHVVKMTDIVEEDWGGEYNCCRKL